MAIYSKNGAMGSVLLEQNNASDITANEYWNIYESLVVDDLHQIGGIYKYLLHFVEKIVEDNRRSVAVIDERYQALPLFCEAKNFKTGYLSKDIVNPTFHELSVISSASSYTTTSISVYKRFH